MIKHAGRQFSATLSTPDLALVGCLRALAEFSQTSSDDPCGAEENNWRAAGQKVTFRFATALDRALFKNEVRRLLPAHLVRFYAESDDDCARHDDRRASYSGFATVDQVWLDRDLWARARGR